MAGKDQRRLLGFHEFVNEHQLHFTIAQAVAKWDKACGLWRTKCDCGKSWQGEDLNLGIEMG